MCPHVIPTFLAPSAHLHSSIVFSLGSTCQLMRQLIISPPGSQPGKIILAAQRDDLLPIPFSSVSGSTLHHSLGGFRSTLHYQVPFLISGAHGDPDIAINLSVFCSPVHPYGQGLPVPTRSPLMSPSPAELFSTRTHLTSLSMGERPPAYPTTLRILSPLPRTLQSECKVLTVPPVRPKLGPSSGTFLMIQVIVGPSTSPRPTMSLPVPFACYPPSITVK